MRGQEGLLSNTFSIWHTFFKERLVFRSCASPESRRRLQRSLSTFLFFNTRKCFLGSTVTPMWNLLLHFILFYFILFYFILLLLHFSLSVLCQRHYFANSGPSNQNYGFPSSHVWMWELDYKESWAPKNWCFRTVVLEKTLESPLDCKEIQPVHPKRDQSWVFTGRTDVEAETPDAKNWVLG